MPWLPKPGNRAQRTPRFFIQCVNGICILLFENHTAVTSEQMKFYMAIWYNWCFCIAARLYQLYILAPRAPKKEQRKSESEKLLDPSVAN
jgi:hypothetical protein